MKKILIVLYSLIAYGLFLATFLYAMGFVGNLVVPRSIDSGPPGPPLAAWVVDCGLLGLFAVQHSVMARQGFKKAWTKVVHPLAERSTYVLIATLILDLLYWQWRPINTVVWKIASPPAVTAIQAAFWAGWAIVVLHNLVMDYFALFGVRQALAYGAENEFRRIEFRTPVLYQWVRHPVYMGFIIAFWTAPVMTIGHLLFSVATTAYIFVGIYFEERDLMRFHGDQYADYRQRVAMLVPFLKSGKKTGTTRAPMMTQQDIQEAKKSL